MGDMFVFGGKRSRSDLDGVLARKAFGTVHHATDKDGKKVAAKKIDGREEGKMQHAGIFLKKKQLVKLNHINVANHTLTSVFD